MLENLHSLVCDQHVESKVFGRFALEYFDLLDMLGTQIDKGLTQLGETAHLFRASIQSIVSVMT